MMIEARKISFQEAWDSSAVFFTDEVLEREIETEVGNLLETAQDSRVSGTTEIKVADIADFLGKENNALDVILKDVGLSEENFIHFILLLRKLRRIPDESNLEWSMAKIKDQIAREPGFALIVAKLLVDGKRDKELRQHISYHFLDMLNYREIKGGTEAARRARYRQSMTCDYVERKEQQVEEKLRTQLEEIKVKHGVNYIKVHPVIMRRDIDLFAIPSFENPWVLIAISFQEIANIDQLTKVQDMLSAYEKFRHHRGNRAFVNFVDGGGWLARRRDLERLVDQCHYFINLHYLDMLKSIVLKHVPEKYFTQNSL